MGQVLHGSATAKPAARRATRRSQEGVRTLARRHGISCLLGSEGGQAGKMRFKAYLIGFARASVGPAQTGLLRSPRVAEVCAEQGKPHLFSAVRRFRQPAFAQLHGNVTRCMPC